MGARRLIATLAASAVGLVVAVVLPATSAQATAYAYWSYWHGTSTSSGWTYSPVGAAGYQVFDGDVEGWRFAVSPDSSAGVQPRPTPSNAFAQVCGGVTAGSGQIRVAVVIDEGVTADAPAHSGAPAPQPFAVCKVLDQSASPSGLDALAVKPAQTVRYGTGSKVGFVCGIDGYPSVGCGGVVANPTSSAKPTSTKAAAPTSSARVSPTSARSPSGTAQQTTTSNASTPNPSTSSPPPPAIASTPSPHAGQTSAALAIGDPSSAASAGGGGSTGAVAGLLAITLVACTAAVIAARRLR